MILQYYNITGDKGRVLIFGPKSGAPIQKKSEERLGPEAKGRRMGRSLGSGRVSWALRVGSGAEPRPKTVLL